MNQICTRLTRILLAAALLLAAPPLAAQPPRSADDGTVSPSGSTPPDLTLEKLQAELAALEAETGLEDAVKDLLRPKYKQAIEALKQAGVYEARAAEYREAIQQGPEQAAALRDQLSALPSTEIAAQITASGSSEDLQKEIDARRAALNQLNDNLSQVTTALAGIKQRPAEISSRLPDAQRELSETLKKLASPELAPDATSPGRAADRNLLQAQQSNLASELETLKQEQLSLSIREEMLQAQQDLLTRQVENASATIDALQSLMSQRLAGEAEQIGLAAALPDLRADDQEAQALLAEVKVLAKEFEEVAKARQQVTAAQADLQERLKLLNEEFDSVSQKLNLGSAGVAMAQVLFDLRHRLRDDVATARSQSMGLVSIEETRLAELQVEKRLREQSSLRRQFAERDVEGVPELLDVREDVLNKLKTQYKNLVLDLAAFDADRRQFLHKAEEVRTSTSEQLLWMRSAPPIGFRTLSEIPDGLKWTFSGAHWAEVGRALQATATRMPVRSASVVIFVAVLLFMRHRIDAALLRTKQNIHRIATDRFGHTWEAMFWTVLLALPVPILLGFVAWILTQDPEASGWMRGIVQGSQIAAWITLAMGLMHAICCEGGLGAVHFGWGDEPLHRCRRAIAWFTAVYIPAFLITCGTVYGEGSHYFGSVGRISLMIGHAWAAMVLWWLFRSSDGILATVIREHPSRLVSRLRFLWYPLVIGCPLALVVLAGFGYIYTSLDLGLGLVITATLIVGGSVLYALAVRWFSIRARRLALSEALEKRRARQQETDSEEQPEESGEVVSVEPDEDELDLESIGDQTRQLLRLLFSLAVLIAIAVFWSQTIPVFATLEKIHVPLAGSLSILDLFQAVLIVMVTCSVVQNLPAVLELALLRSTNVETGTRAAIETLCQYGVTAIGLGLLAGVLHVDWAQFGWIAAALSVGLGFGLQEVVANFVCGLIVLFECPIRVGDVVTVEGTTGTVTKIRMRATTITNWDRQEFVVPNKNLITGTILNWTLTASINRIIIPVGVAYGTDTERARQILLQVAADHPNVVDDPPPMATFEEFADSSLALTLRAYLPDVDNRLKTITELHADIGKRFAAAGIEIAFPQRDLHLRSGWETTHVAGSSDDATIERGNAESSPITEGHRMSQPEHVEQSR